MLRGEGIDDTTGGKCEHDSDQIDSGHDPATIALKGGGKEGLNDGRYSGYLRFELQQARVRASRGKRGDRREEGLVMRISGRGAEGRETQGG